MNRCQYASPAAFSFHEAIVQRVILNYTCRNLFSSDNTPPRGIREGGIDMSGSFTPDEIKELGKHRIAIFADRVIINAQPPLSKERADEIESFGSGPLPADLRELWGLTAGGELCYDLNVRMGERIEPVGFSELFYDGSDGYHDLQGWIDHELEIAEEASGDDDWNGTIFAIPFGGFEYGDRIYTVVEEGDDYGSVLAWKQGFPPAWKGVLHEDSIGTVGSSVKDAFGRLCLEADPRNSNGEYNPGENFLEYVKEAVGNGLDSVLAEKLTSFYCEAVIDWKSELSDGSITSDENAARVALIHAAEGKDANLIINLSKVLPSIDIPCRGLLRPIEIALQKSNFSMCGVFIECGSKVSADSLEYLNGPIPPSLLSIFIEKGAIPSIENAIICAATGAAESADIIISSLSASDPSAPVKFGNAKTEAISKLKEDLKKVKAGKLGHYLGESGLAERIRNLETFR